MENEIFNGNSNADKTIINSELNTDKTMIGLSINCPICGTDNLPSEKYCADCGFLLSSQLNPEINVSISNNPILRNAIDGREYYLKTGENIIGREATDILIDDPTVSRKHAILKLVDDHCYIEDSGSTNGTMRNGEKVSSPVEVFDGDEIKIGSVALMLDMPMTSDVISADAEDETSDSATDDEPIPIAYLLMNKKPDAKFMIYEGINTIGRKSENDIQISDDPYLSGMHAEISADNDLFEIVDMGSTNGTIVNGVKLDEDDPLQLKNGDQITFGRTQLVFNIINNDNNHRDDSV